MGFFFIFIGFAGFHGIVILRGFFVRVPAGAAFITVIPLCGDFLALQPLIFGRGL